MKKINLVTKLLCVHTLFAITSIAEANKTLTSESYDHTNYFCSDRAKTETQKNASLKTLDGLIKIQVDACAWFGGFLINSQPQFTFINLKGDGCQVKASVTTKCQR